MLLMKDIEDDTKKMESFSMYMDWRNYYFLNVHTNQRNLQIQCNSYLNSKDIF